MPRLRTASLLLAALTLSASAAGQESTPLPAAGLDPSREADQLFLEARQDFEAGRKQAAYEKYKKAWGLKQTYEIAGNLGNVELELGKVRDAAEHISYALAHLPALGVTPEQRAKVKSRLDQAKAEVGTLKIAVSAPDAQVLIDGAAIGKSPLAPEVFVEPGPHTVEAKLAGYQEARTAVTVEKGTAESIELTLVAKADTPPPPTGDGGSKPPPFTPRSMAPAVVGGVLAVGALGAGIGLTVVSSGKGSSADEKRDELVASRGPRPCQGPYAGDAACQEVQDGLDARDGLGTGAMIAFAGAGVLAVATIVYVVTAPSAPSGQSGWSVRPVLGLEQQGLLLGRSF